MRVPDKEREIIRKWFPVLLREDAAFREEVMAEFTGVLATKDDIAKILSKLEEHSRILEEHSRIIREHTKRIENFDRTLTALGARWGILAEEAFRAGMRGILEDLGYKVRKWRVRDEKGKVYGKPTMVEADILIRDKKHYLIEIKSSVSEFDVVGFKRIAELYKELQGIEPRLLIISPFVSKRATILGDEFGIEFYKGAEEAVGVE
jgi:hypothetical protein